MTVHLETERLILRRPAPRDMDAGVAFYMSERAQYVGGHLGRFHAWRQMAMMLGHWDINGYGLWAVTAKGDDTALGLVGPFFPEGWPEREIGWLMFDGAERKGFAFEAARASLHDCRTRLGWGDIVHYIDVDNDRSVALAKRLGATLDPQATQPKPGNPCLIYRNRLDEAVQ